MVRLLGTPQVTVEGVVAPLRLTRPAALAVRLVCQREGLSRSAIAATFWPDAGEREARTFTRVLLHRCRALPWVGAHLVSAGQLVRLDLPCDVTRFRDAVANEDWESASAVYGGAFLDGADAGDVPAFDAWAASEREELGAAAARAWRSLAQARVSAGEHRSGADAWARYLHLEPFDEAAVAAQLEALAGASLMAEARRVWSRHRDRWRQELDAEPPAWLLAAAERLLGGVRAIDPSGTAGAGSISAPAVALPAAQPAPRRDDRVLPTPTAPLLGRADELAALRSQVASGTRMLAVVGLGGMGKSRLALEVLRHEGDRFGDGAYQVAVPPGADEAATVTAVETAFGLALDAGASRRDALIAALASREALVVLDGLDDLEVVRDLLRALVTVPGITWLMTSRVRPSLPDVWTLDLRGLPTPPPDAEAADVRSSPGVAAFVAAVRRTLPGFDPDDDDVRAIGRIVRAVGGMPLALELAAAWSPVMTCDRIAAAVEAGDDLLEGPATAVDASRSVRRVLEASWGRLRSRPQAALAAVSVFAGAFDVEVAGEVTGASPATLIGLVHASLLQSVSPGRVVMHDVVRHFVAQRRPATVDRAHALYYLQRLEALDRALRGDGQVEALGSVQRELPDLERAWSHAVEAEPTLLEPAHVHALGHVAEVSGLERRLGPWLEAALARVRGRPDDARRASLEAALWVRLAEYWYVTGTRVASRDAAERARALADATGDEVTSFRARWAQSIGSSSDGDLDRAVAQAEAALAGADAVGDAYAAAGILMGLGNLTVWRDGDVDAADHYLQRAHALFEHLGAPRGLAATAINLGATATDRGDQEAARAWFEAGAAHARRVRHLRLLGVATANLGHLALMAGDHERAKAFFDESIVARVDAGDAFGVATVRVKRAAVHAARGATEVARLDLDAAIATMREAGDLGGLVSALVDRARLWLKLGRVDDARPSVDEALRLVADRGALEDQLLALLAAALLWRAEGEVERARFAASAIALDPGATAEARRSAERLLSELGVAPLTPAPDRRALLAALRVPAGG